jgi:hypothetical protein
MFSRTYAIQPLSIFFNIINLNNFFFLYSSYLDNSNDVEPIDNEDDPNLLIEQGMNGNDAKHDAAFIRKKRSDLSSEAQRQAKTFISLSLYLSISILIYENYTRFFFFIFIDIQFINWVNLLVNFQLSCKFFESLNKHG